MRMRVLWFTHLPSDAVNRHFGRPTTSGGYWIHSLVNPLVESGEVELAIATATAGDPECQFRDGAVDYFNIPQSKMLEAYGVFQKVRSRGYLKKAARLIDAWRPDVIHVHGTERFFGLVRARGLTRAPTVVSVQGLMEPYSQWTFGEMNWRQIAANTTLWELTRNATLPAEHWRRMRVQVPMEREILRGVDAVIGRTAWDHAHVRRANPAVLYFHVEEMMRPEFGSAEPWDLSRVRRGSIVTTLSPSPLKGVPTLLEAISILRRWGHDVRLSVAGMRAETNRRSYSAYAGKLVVRLGLKDVVEFVGWQDAPALVERFHGSHCFVSPSLIENSSNAICEAQLLGMPCVASHTGGTPTLVQDERTGLLFSRHDPAMLAYQIERVLSDDALAASLGRAARESARRRHEPTKIVAELLNCYRSIAARQ
jgi:glycosyltransferase involved in cell wall biosynthesis